MGVKASAYETFFSVEVLVTTSLLLPTFLIRLLLVSMALLSCAVSVMFLNELLVALCELRNNVSIGRRCHGEIIQGTYNVENLVGSMGVGL